MSAWSSSPYRRDRVYIGGANRGCSQPNLTAGWVRKQITAGWGLIPIYVGLQAPGTCCGCAAIKRGEAKSQGRAAARDAIADAQGLGLGSGSPVYFDMEGYSRTSTNSKAVLRFLSGWTARLHAGGYLSGVYSSAGSGIVDLASRYGSRTGSRMTSGSRTGTARTDPRPIHPGPLLERPPADPPVPRRAQRVLRRPHDQHRQRLRRRRRRGGERRRCRRRPDDLDLCPDVHGLISNSGCPYPEPRRGRPRALPRLRRRRPPRGRPLHDHRRRRPRLPLPGQPRLPLNTHLAAPSPLQLHLRPRPVRLPGSRLRRRQGPRPDRLRVLEAPAGIPTQAIYSCRNGTTGERTVSLDPGCNKPDEHQPLPLGFTISVASLGRYLDSVDGDRRQGDHFTTTGAVDPAYRFQGNLGYLYNTHLAAPRPLQLHLRPRPVPLPGSPTAAAPRSSA